MTDVPSKTKTVKKILVTGGAGFIGSHLCERLVAEQYEVACLDNFDEYYSPTLKRSNISVLLKNNRFGLIEGDIRDEDLLEKLFEEAKFDGVVHLAALGGVRYSMSRPNEYVDVNVKGTVNLLQACKKFKVKQFVLASSSSVYGDRDEGPFRESDMTDSQISPYSVTKKSAELMCGTYAALYEIQTVVLRFFNVYGPRVRPYMACSNFTEALLKDKPIVKYGDGTTGRDYTYVDDIVEGVIRTIERPMDFEVINLGNSHPVSLNELIETFEKVTDKKAQIDQQQLQAGDVKLTFADISKAKKLLDWEPKVGLEEGVKRLVDWYRKEN